MEIVDGLPLTAGKTLIIVPSKVPFSDYESNPSLVWMCQSQLYVNMVGGINIPTYGISQVFVKVLAIQPRLGQYLSYIKSQGFSDSTYVVRDHDQLLRWLEYLRTGINRVEPARVEAPLLARIRQATCQVFEVGLEEFLLLSHDAFPKIATVLVMRRYEFGFTQISALCKISETQAKIAAVLGDMAMKKYPKFGNKVDQIERRCS